MTERDARVEESDMAEQAGVAGTKQKGGFLRSALETIALVALAFLLAQGIKVFVVQPFVIPTGSMIPTIEIGNRVIAEKISYRFRDPRAGEIVVFDDPTAENPQLIKRVIAVGGQTVDLKDGSVYVDGRMLEEPYVHGQPTDPLAGTVQFPLTVPEGYLLMMGDNRTRSSDGRVFGPQPVSTVKGHAVVTYWPPSQMGMLPETPATTAP